MAALSDALVGTAPPTGALLAADASVRLEALRARTSLSSPVEDCRGRSIVIATRDQLTAALALIELDGVARRLVLCTADVSREHLQAVVATAAADTVVVDAARAADAAGLGRELRVDPRLHDAALRAGHGTASEWVLLTSGTTGAPKLVLHTLDSLGGALPRNPGAGSVWSTFYDIRRYGGLQIFLRAVLSGAPLVLSSAGESTHDFLARAAAAGVTHVSGTPSHWRRALMSGSANLIRPKYVRLSGEIADQPLLDSLRATYPDAQVAHAFASTEAGVAFDVTDGRAGFPAELLNSGSGALLKVEDGTLRIRSARNATRYLGEAPASLSGADGYVDTGDLVELRDGRYYFMGRKGGVINVGGLKVHPEEVEAVINADPRVRMSLVKARKSPITGAVVIADVVLADPALLGSDSGPSERLKHDLLTACRRSLASHKVPTMLRFVPALDLTPAGKLVRPGA